MILSIQISLEILGLADYQTNKYKLFAYYKVIFSCALWYCLALL